MKKNKKMIIPIIFVLMFSVTSISGCIYLNNFPVDIFMTELDYDFSCVRLMGVVGFPLCNAKNYTFVYDTKSHENWSDYKFKLYNNFIAKGFFYNHIDFSNVTNGITYYVRAIAYCYDFEKPYKNYEEKFYQSDEKTFIVP